MSGWVGDHLDYPMFIATAAAGDERAGCLVGFATQCSIDPLRFIVFLSRNNRTYRVARHAPVLAVHVVPEGRGDLAQLFGGATGDEVDKFARCDWKPGPEGVPVLTSCRSWFAGKVTDRYDAGDHVGFVLEPIDAEASPGRALGFQEVKTMEPGHEA